MKTILQPIGSALKPPTKIAAGGHWSESIEAAERRGSRIKQKPSTFPVLALIVATLATGVVGSRGQDVPGSGEPGSAMEYRDFAMKQEGDAARGERLFADAQRTACSQCHTVDGRGTKAGPDLSTVGDQFSRSELIDAVLTPSARIAVGYGTTSVETRSGESHQGVLKLASEEAIELMGADGQRVRIALTDVLDRQSSSISLMPEGLHLALSLPEFTDLIEYLVSRKQAVNTLTRHRGMPDEIAPLAQSVILQPLLRDDIKLPAVQGKAGTGLVWFGQVPGFAHRFLVMHQSGMIWLLEKKTGGDRQTVFVDITKSVFSASGPNGLLGAAFHPQFRQNRKYYLKYQVFEDEKIATVLEERQFSPDFQHDSDQPPRRLLKIVSVAEHHNGGCIEFGPDGFLYLGMGDSAPNFDPEGFAQDPRRLFGKMLRIDVDHHDPGMAYRIPADNPFVGRTDVRPEIWASGLREPWRFSFDPVTGDLWVADLGQERGDEVDIVRRGDNLGWNVYEGFELFSTGQRQQQANYVPPLFASQRRHGSSIIGGRVYRGDPKSSFAGVYVFGDNQSRRIWGLTQEDGALGSIRQLATCPQAITSFAADEEGRLYVVGYQGMIYQLDFSGADFRDAPSFPATTK